MDDLFDFSSDIGEEDEEESVKNRSNKRPRKALPSFNANCHGSAPFDAVFGPDPDDTTRPFPVSFFIPLSSFSRVLGVSEEAEFVDDSVGYGRFWGRLGVSRWVYRLLRMSRPRVFPELCVDSVW